MCLFAVSELRSSYFSVGLNCTWLANNSNHIWQIVPVRVINTHWHFECWKCGRRDVANIFVVWAGGSSNALTLRVGGKLDFIMLALMLSSALVLVCFSTGLDFLSQLYNYLSNIFLNIPFLGATSLCSLTPVSHMSTPVFRCHRV